MSFFSRLFRKHAAPVKTVQDKPADRSVHAKNGTDALTELRYQARTGDPKLSGKHRSGSF